MYPRPLCSVTRFVASKVLLERGWGGDEQGLHVRNNELEAIVIHDNKKGMTSIENKNALFQSETDCYIMFKSKNDA